MRFIARILESTLRLWPVFLFFLGLKIIDAFIVGQGGWFDPDSVVGGIDDNAIVFTAFDSYPYSGSHTQADSQSGFVRSGDHGFFVDFDLDNPPPKPPRTARIAFIGGSGAVGYGADRNNRMMYRILEALYRQEQTCGPNTRLEMINLAMGGSTTYQNFVMLNLWGHGLDLDGIVSFSG
ncbi:MAG: hypothetical protein JJ899_10575, partial [Alphaproteobacteria bacterium]|nr:hypothetical protein [Alphaproteobacteria bacterium]